MSLVLNLEEHKALASGLAVQAGIFSKAGVTPRHFLRSNLPSANCLVVFEATARHLSFTKAAAVLGVTQAAVSRQVRLLEDFIGVQVFNRVHRGINLTNDGTVLYDSVSRYLEGVARTVIEIKNLSDVGNVRISASNAISVHWLIPCLTRFRDAYPKYRVTLVSDDPSLEPSSGGGVDLVLRYGIGRWPGLEATWVCDEEVFPVCSPEFVRKTGPISSIEQLTALPLLESDKDKSHGHLAWSAWLGHFGLHTSSQSDNMFSNYAVALEGARAGQGVALGWKRCVQSMLDKGDLVRPLDVSLPMSGGYYIGASRSALLNPATKALRKWLAAAFRV